MAPESKSESLGRVAVVGLGAAGITVVKNLLEIGFDVVGYEQRNEIGGIWTFSPEGNYTTVTKATVANTSKERNCYQDFPFPEKTPTFPTANDVNSYLRSYAGHFDLNRHFQLGSSIEWIDRSPDKTKWQVRVTQGGRTRTEIFEKAVLTTGPYHSAYIPEFEGQDRFKGKILHVQQFKEPEEFVDKRVVVVGIGNCGGDTAVELSKVARKTWLAHRSGVAVVHRFGPDNQAYDRGISRRLETIGKTIAAYAPELGGKLAGYVLRQKMLKTFPNIDPSWGLSPAPAPADGGAIVNDSLLHLFADGSITSITGHIVRSFDSTDSKSSSIEFSDGTILEDVDAIIFCTGYHANYSILGPDANPTLFDSSAWDNSTHRNGLPYARLYQTIFHPAHATSLAYIGAFNLTSVAAFSDQDLIGQAIAQVFSGRFALPSQIEMERWCDTNYASCVRRISNRRLLKVQADPLALERWLNDAAGNNVNEMLGWGWNGWKFWWGERELYKLVMDGMNTPFVYRLFEGRQGARKKWEGARAEIRRVNENVKDEAKAQKDKIA